VLWFNWLKAGSVTLQSETTEPPGHKSLVANVVVVGLFEEEEERTGITSDVVKLKGEDLDTPGCLIKDWLSRYAGDSNSWVRSPLALLRENPSTVMIYHCRVIK